MKKQIILGALLMLAIGSAQAALIGRLPATLGGNDYQAYYDDQFDITWIADASYALSESYGWSINQPTGTMTAANAASWVNDISFAGFSSWRLPTMDKDSDGNIEDCRLTWSSACYDNEFYSLKGYVNFGATEPMFSDHFGFSNVYNQNYWSSTASQVNSQGVPDRFYTYRFNVNGIDDSNGSSPFAAWAVADGDVFASNVPVPAALWLFGSGLGLLGWMRRKPA